MKPKKTQPIASPELFQQWRALEKATDAASKAMQAFPRGPMGLTPDQIKRSAPFIAADNTFRRAMKALQVFNRAHCKAIQAYRRANPNWRTE